MKGRTFMKQDAIEFDVIGENNLPNGRSYYICICPFCKRHVRIQKWSYATTGKKCDCGAVLRSGYAFVK
jgi:hypothetical protein